MRWFDFGSNWQAFSARRLDAGRLTAAVHSLQALLGKETLGGLSFLDVGCGTGLFSIAAHQLGAVKVVGIDLNPSCISVSEQNRDRLAPKAPVLFQLGSALNREDLHSLGRFDIVYAWGSLHHTGAMWAAIRNVAQQVSPGGLLVLAIYNKHFTSPVWKLIKWFYNHLPGWGRVLMAVLFSGIIYIAKFLVTGRNPLEKERGMDFWFDVVDWVGGYPYEYTTPLEVEKFVKAQGFNTRHRIPARVPTGCNEFVFVKNEGPYFGNDLRDFMPTMKSGEYDQGWEMKWDDMKKYGPFSRHLRRIIKNLIRPLAFHSVLDVGCGQGSLLWELQAQFPHMKPTGTDLSMKALDLARRRVPEGEFHVSDLAQESLEDKFDLVICSEVLEHIPDDQTAIRHLARMTGKYLVVSGPQGRMRRFEATVGHVRNYAYGELVHKLEQNGFRMVRVIEWGFPFYSPLYRNFLDLLGGRGTEGQFGPARRLTSIGLYHLFRLNSAKRGDELIVLAEIA